MTALAKYAIRQTEWALRDYIMTVEKIPADKIEWKPTEKSRHVLDLVQECAFVNLHWAKVLRAQEWVEWDQAGFDKLRTDNPTIEQAVAVLKETTADYLRAVAEVPGDFYDKQIKTPWPKPWDKTSVGGSMLHAHYHLCYHEGQINYISVQLEDSQVRPEN